MFRPRAGLTDIFQATLTHEPGKPWRFDTNLEFMMQFQKSLEAE